MYSPRQTSKTTKGSASQFQPTRTKPKEVSFDDLLNAKGASGTYIVNGFLEADYNPKLAGEKGLEKYDEMRRSDSKVRQSLMVCKLPILSTEWYFEAAVDPETGVTGEAEEDVKDFCEKAFFEKMEQPWPEHLAEVLTCLEFGFSLFEKVYTADDDDEFIWIKKFGSRKQTTVVKWETEDGEPGIVQQLPSTITDPDHENYGKSKISIPAAKLLLFTYQKEGDDYAGISILRSAYRHWYIKDALYKFDAIRHERQGVGIPYIKLPKGANEKDKVEARLILKNIRANEQGGVILPNTNWEFGFVDLQAGNVSDIWKSIDHHNQEIANNVLAMFLNLVSGDGGSRALSEDQSDFFLLANEALANMIEDVYNRHVVPELVDLNFEVQNYPKLRHRKLGSVDYSTISSVLSTLVGAGVIESDEDLEEWARDIIDAPKKVVLEEDEMDDGMDDENIDPITGLPIDPEIDPDTGLPIDPATGLPIEPEEAEPLTPEEQDAQDAAGEVLDDIEATEDEINDASEVFLALECKAQGFRIVSEATKQKISEALKKAKPGDTEQTLARKKAEALARKNARHQKALANVRMRKAGGGLIAQRRAARLKKAGVKDSAARQKTNAKSIADILSGKPAKKKSKLGTAIKNLATRTKKGKKNKKAKKGATVKPAATALRVTKQVKNDKPPIYKSASKPAPKVSSKPISRLAKAVANRKAKRVAAKKKVTAHEHDHKPSEYGRIFAETAKHVLLAQRSIPKDNYEHKPFVFKESTYESWRPLTFAEQKVDWKSLNRTMEKFRSALNSEIDHITADQKADILAQVKRAVEGNDIAAVGVIRARYTGDLSAALTNVQKEMFEAGKISASLEMGVRSPATAREVMGALKVGNDKLVQKMTGDMESAASLAVSQTIARKGGSISGTGTAEAVAAASEAIDKVLESKGQLNTLSIMGSLNLGRASIFERYPEKVYGFQYSAIIDSKTTDLCLSLDGRVVKAGSADFYSYGPPQHYECRSIWVEILEEEEFKPETDDIPSRITSNSSIDVFEDLAAPIIEAGSPAIKVLQQELDYRKAQVEQYQKDGQYQNRIDSHQSRIAALEKALEVE